MATEYTKFGTEQMITVLVEDNQKESICLEVIQNRAELGTSVIDQFGDEKYATVTLDKDQLWEHIHNCIDALEGLA